MTIEERARGINNGTDVVAGTTTCEYIFSELKKSEDEQSKKWILEYLYDGLRKSDEQFKSQFKAAIAWLEKQGDHKPADMVEPKFHKGDWVVKVKGNVIAQILDVKEQYYIGLDTKGNDFTVSRFLSDDKIHRWTIKDAKDGDVLVVVDDKHPFIYKGCIDPRHPNSPVAYCGIDSYGYFCIGGNNFDNWWTNKKVQPATKEQRKALLSDMKDAGYTFDFKKKELQKIDQSNIINVKGNNLKIHNYVNRKKIKTL